jgi:hypothetical protein
MQGGGPGGGGAFIGKSAAKAGVPSTPAMAIMYASLFMTTPKMKIRESQDLEAITCARSEACDNFSTVILNFTRTNVRFGAKSGFE